MYNGIIETGRAQRNAKKEDLFMKRRKLFALLMTAAMAVSSMSMAVNVFAEEDTTEETAESEEPAEGEPTAVTTVGPMMEQNSRCGHS